MFLTVLPCFNSTMVRLKVKADAIIKADPKYVSIPQWFD